LGRETCQYRQLVGLAHDRYYASTFIFDSLAALSKPRPRSYLPLVLSR